MNSEMTVETTQTPAAGATASAQLNPDVMQQTTNQTVNQSPLMTPARTTLYRHPTDKLLGGVCGGIAEFLGWDPTLVRILWVVATLTTGGGGFLAYLALWMLLPVGTAQRGQIQPAAIELNERSLGLAAKLLIGLGLVWLLANLGILPSLWNGFWAVMQVLFWPALLIGIGYLLLRNTGQTADWRINLNGWQNRMRVNVKTPSRDEVRGSLRRLRDRLPLKRSRADKLFFGVCGGIGQTLGIDANLVRLLWVALSIGSVGMGVLVYVLLGWLLPEERNLALTPNNVAEPQSVQVIDGTATYKV